jgi:hypothetical protein|tara:strand:+ start:12519 stop:12809 length:291 start_codon:yes stop_codon:yes gene_type:complete
VVLIDQIEARDDVRVDADVCVDTMSGDHRSAKPPFCHTWSLEFALSLFGTCCSHITHDDGMGCKKDVHSVQVQTMLRGVATESMAASMIERWGSWS